MSWIDALQILGTLAVAVLVGWKHYRADRKMKAVVASGTPAFPWKLHMADILAAPELWRERLRGKVRSIHAVSAPTFEEPDGHFKINHDRSNYASFLVDIEGEPHDLESSSRWEPIETHAAWLAQLLEVPFENRI